MDRGVTSESLGMVDNIITQGKQRLADSGKTREAAAEVLSRIITRPDLVFIFIFGFISILFLNKNKKTQPILAKLVLRIWYSFLHFCFIYFIRKNIWKNRKMKSNKE